MRRASPTRSWRRVQGLHRRGDHAPLHPQAHRDWACASSGERAWRTRGRSMTIFHFDLLAIVAASAFQFAPVPADITPRNEVERMVLAREETASHDLEDWLVVHRSTGPTPRRRSGPPGSGASGRRTRAPTTSTRARSPPRSSGVYRSSPARTRDHLSCAPTRRRGPGSRRGPASVSLPLSPRVHWWSSNETRPPATMSASRRPRSWTRSPSTPAT